MPDNRATGVIMCWGRVLGGPLLLCDEAPHLSRVRVVYLRLRRVRVVCPDFTRIHKDASECTTLDTQCVTDA